MPARALGRVATAAAMEAAEEGEKTELAGEEPARALGREATAASTGAAETLVLAGVEPARAANLGVAEEVPMAHPPGRVLLAVLGGLAVGAWSAAETFVAEERGLVADEVEAAAQVAATRRAATLASMDAWRVAAASRRGSVVARESAPGLPDSHRRFEAAASEWIVKVAGTRSGTASALARAAGGARLPLQRVLFAVAVAGRKTASSRDSGCAHDGAGGITCQGC